MAKKEDKNMILAGVIMFALLCVLSLAACDNQRGNGVVLGGQQTLLELGNDSDMKVLE